MEAGKAGLERIQGCHLDVALKVKALMELNLVMDVEKIK